MDLKSFLKKADLSTAVEVATDAVKRAPADASARLALFEVLCFSGDLDRALKQLDAIGSESMESAYGVLALRSLVEAEHQRRSVLAGEAEPSFAVEGRDWATEHRRLHHQQAAGVDTPAGGRDTWLAEACRARGTLDGLPFSELRDGDDLLAPVLEAFVEGQYVWIPWGAIEALESEPPRSLRHLCWFPVELTLRDQQQKAVHLPALYVDSWRSQDDRIRLGQATDWEERAGLMRGLGRRILFANGEERELLSIRKLRVEPTP